MAAPDVSDSQPLPAGTPLDKELKAAQEREQRRQLPTFEIDRYFLIWLQEMQVSFMLSFYSTGQVISFGSNIHPVRGLQHSLFITEFNRPMGICHQGSTMWVGAAGQLWGYTNTVPPPQERRQLPYDSTYAFPREEVGRFDGHYVPRQIYAGTDTDVHDLTMDDQGQVYYVSASFSCVCKPSATHSFSVYWQPPWITKICPEDRCHLNGLCCRDGKPRYVTAVSRDDIKGGWREHRIGHGVVYDLQEERVVCQGLSMPHSPRWFLNRLWVLEAGTGYLGYVEESTGQFVKKVFIPGFLRGLCLVKNRYLVVTSSEDRHENTFKDLPLGARLKELDIQTKCGLHVIDSHNFDILHTVLFKSPHHEVYDICALPQVTRPMIENFQDLRNLREYQIDYSLLPSRTSTVMKAVKSNEAV